MPNRLISLQAADEGIETVLHEVMKHSFSIEERTRSRRMAALHKVMPLPVIATMPVRISGTENRGSGSTLS